MHSRLHIVALVPGLDSENTGSTTQSAIRSRFCLFNLNSKIDMDSNSFSGGELVKKCH